MVILEIVDKKALATAKKRTVPSLQTATIGDYGLKIVRQKTMEEINFPLRRTFKSDNRTASKCVIQ